MKPSRISMVLVALLFMAVSHVPTANTREAIKAYVEDAAKVVAKHGASCDTFLSKEWMSGDYYVVVVGPDGRLRCHPNRVLVGAANASIVDVNGKRVGSMLVDLANKGGGWLEYVWPRPGSQKAVTKTSYTTRVKGPDGKWYIVVAGGYDMK